MTTDSELWARLEALERAHTQSQWQRLEKLERQIAADESRRTTTTTTAEGYRMTIRRDNGGESTIIARTRAEAEAMAAKLRGASATTRRDGKAEVRELRSAGTGPLLSGYAAIFNSLSEVLYEPDLGRFREKVQRGAFAESLRRRDDCVLLANHEGLPLGSTRGKTLTLVEDARGLKFSSRLDPADPDVQRVVAKARRGDLRCSFAFRLEDDQWDVRESPPTRTVTKARLSDVSVVAKPAYSATSVSVAGA